MTLRTPTAGRWHAAASALVAVFLLAATACSGGGQAPPGAAPGAESPAATESTTASPTPTPTPTASYKPADASGRAQNVPVPVLPEAAKAETKEGLEAFARYWFQLLSYGYETGDLAPLSVVTSNDCNPCGKAKDVINSWNADGKWLVGGKLTTPSVSTDFIIGPDAKYQVVVQAHQSPLTYVRKDGSVARSDAQADDTGNLLFISFTDGAWKLVDIGRIVG